MLIWSCGVSSESPRSFILVKLIIEHHKIKLLLILIQVEFEEGTEVNLVFVSLNVTPSKGLSRLACLLKISAYSFTND